ncbi:MAG: ArnT family glycosyltransferase, partial [Thermodesulfobacteriota bacterium]
ARVALLDLPLAFLVTLSILFFLMWKESERTIHLLLSAAVCGLSVLLKGPVGPMIVTMAVVLNVLLLGGGATFRRRWKESILAVVLFLAIAGSWTGAMYLIWSDLFIQEVYNELIKARFLTSYSTGPEAVLGGILLLLLPWSFLYLRSLASTLGRGLHHENRSALWLLAWSLASLVPFLLLKVKFERYLLVAVPPAVLLLCTVPYRSSLWQKLAFRSTAVLYGLVGLGLIAFGFWFRVSPLWVMALLLILLGLFCFRAWKARDLAATALTAGLFHMVLFGLFYPGIGIQAIPPDLLSEIRRNAAPVYYYRGDNPGLLSIKLRKSIQKVKGPAELKQLSESGVKIIVEEKYEKEFSEVLTKAGLPASQPALRFTSFYSRVGWINFPREGTTVEDWKRAFDERSLEGLKTGFALYYVKRGKV